MPVLSKVSIKDSASTFNKLVKDGFAMMSLGVQLDNGTHTVEIRDEVINISFANGGNDKNLLVLQGANDVNGKPADFPLTEAQIAKNPFSKGQKVNITVFTDPKGVKRVRLAKEGELPTSGKVATKKGK